MKRYIAEQRSIKFYTIDAIDLAREIGLGNRTNTILQSAFFTLANVIPHGRGRPVHEGCRHAVLQARRARTIVDMNHAAIDAGAQRSR